MQEYQISQLAYLYERLNSTRVSSIIGEGRID